MNKYKENKSKRLLHGTVKFASGEELVLSVGSIYTISGFQAKGLVVNILCYSNRKYLFRAYTRIFARYI